MRTYGPKSPHERRVKTGTVLMSALMILMMTLALVPVLCSAGAAGGTGVYAAAKTAVIGKKTGGTVTRQDSIVFDAVDLTTIDPDTISSGTVYYPLGMTFSDYISGFADISISSSDLPDGVFFCDTEVYSNTDPDDYTRYKGLAVSVGFDASSVCAGTYTAEVTVDLGEEVSANGGAYTCTSDGVLTIPVSVTATGDNPSFGPKVTGVTAAPGNNCNKITWAAAEGCTLYRIYRREGKDSSAGTPEIGKYVYLGKVNTMPDYDMNGSTFSLPEFYDRYAENGMTYSYIIISGDGDSAYSGNPSKSVSAAPKSSIRYIPAAPYMLEGSVSGTDAHMTWHWNTSGSDLDPEENYEEDESGEGIIDHFNLYRDGRLIKQIRQNAVKTSEYYDSFLYSWSATVPLPVKNAEYTVWVTAVDTEGTESEQGTMVTVSQNEDDYSIEISSHRAGYYDNETEDDTGELVSYKGVWIEAVSNGICRFEAWRKAAGAADSAYGKVTFTETPDGYYVDTGAAAGGVYTYKLIGYSSDGRSSDPYVFNLAADPDSDYYIPGGYIYELNLRTADGETASVYARDYGEGTYRLYRDGKVINTWSGYSGTVTYTDTPPEDGEHSYYITWTSKKFPSLTVRSNTVIFCRDTSDVDPDELEGAPDAPSLSGRIDEYGAVSMSWRPASTGGDVDGYIIYRTDNGIPNTLMWHNTWTHPLQDEDANGRFLSRDASRTTYSMNVDWYDSGSCDPETAWQSPHNMWIVAYNEMGISDPSNVLSYSAVNGEPPENVDEETPGAPQDISAWVEWEDEYGTKDSMEATLHVSWAEPETGGVVEYYDITLNDGSDEETYNIDPYSTGGTRSFEKTVTWNVGETFTITVSARNDLGTVSAEPVTVTVGSAFALKAEKTGSTSAELTWSDLQGDVTAEGYQLWRRANLSAWTKIAEADGAGDKSYEDTGLDPGTKYEYYAAATASDGTVYSSIVRDITTSSRDGNETETVTGLSAREANGDVILSWTPPETSGLPTYYIVEYQTADKDPDADSWSSIYLNSDTFGKSTGGVIQSWKYDSGGICSTLGQYEGTDLHLRVRPYWYNHGSGAASEYITFTWPEESSIVHEDDPPEPITPAAEAGDGKVTISWDADTSISDNESEATYYQLVRTWGSSSVVFTIPVVPGQPSYQYVDDDSDIMNGVQYSYELRPCSSYYKRAATSSTMYWYSPWCYMHSVRVVPNGPTTDQITADNVTAFADELIEGKPADLSEMTEEYRRKVYELKANYEELTDYQKKLIGSEKCAEIESLISEIELYDAGVKYEDDEDLTEVTDAIDGLKTADQITLDDEEAVAAARALYDALPEDEKQLVTNYDELTAAEAAIKQLRKDAADTAAAEAMNTKLESIDPDTITADTLTDELERSIADIRWEYDNMTKAQKAKVDQNALQKLIDAENKISDITGVGHIHDMKTVGAKSPTCSESGNTKYYVCSKCGKYYSDADGENEIELADTVIPADASLHDWTEWTPVQGEEATCTEAGTSERTCTVCGKKEDRTDAALGHQWVETGRTEPTETEPGEISFRCAVCGETKTEPYYITSIELTDENVTVRNATYTGKAITTASVTYDGAVLTEDVDYTISYADNINAGTATVTVTGIGDYTGTVTKTFTIARKKISAAVTLKAAAYTWNNKVKTPAVTVRYGKTTLKKGTHYKVTYAKGRKNIGIYKVKVTLIGNYSGSKTVSFRINPKGTTALKAKAVKKSFTAKWKKQAGKMPKARVAGYQVQYSLNKNFKSGNKTVTVKGYKKTSRKIAGLKSGKRYYYRVRTYIKVGGKTYYSVWSKARSVKTK